MEPVELIITLLSISKQEFSNSLQHMTHDIPAWSNVILVTVLMFCLMSCTSCDAIAFSLYLKDACPVYYKDHIATSNKPLMKFTTELLSLNTSSTPACDLPVGYDHEWPLLFQTCMCTGSSYLKNLNTQYVKEELKFMHNFSIQWGHTTSQYNYRT